MITNQMIKDRIAAKIDLLVAHLSSEHPDTARINQLIADLRQLASNII